MNQINNLYLYGTIFGTLFSNRIVRALRSGAVAMLCCAVLGLISPAYTQESVSTAAREQQIDSQYEPSAITSSSDSQPLLSQAPSEPLHVEIVTLKYHGFEPEEIIRPKGRFILRIKNRADVREPLFRLLREAGEKLKEAKLPSNKLNFNTSLDLPPGQYLLTEDSNPKWGCLITIKPK